MSRCSFNQIATTLWLLVMTVWSGMRYYRSGHVVYYAGSDAWWVQGGVPMAHYAAGTMSNLAAFGRNLTVVWAQCRRSIAICTAVYVTVMWTSWVYHKAQQRKRKEKVNGVSRLSSHDD